MIVTVWPDLGSHSREDTLRGLMIVSVGALAGMLMVVPIISTARMIVLGIVEVAVRVLR